ncbi:hypothetical protein [Clostridium butyricum]|uniref:BppU N-terminal domain-containing protein n=1 Tax=Clostridium butyricum TaxID=1492 RepID=A0AAP9RD95_CLOBU|nr:hypothetical protein [Clostridium butyricum]MBZ5748543.1 hypothetical protein [Clostridium butyricum]MDI9210012.1 hypothetical protein [Clostridium butyricum]QMW90225.1 hypothetical protein FF104_04460 [Clostridium butyricum]QMW90576.1 hypothetical protein FF104_06275 [Clostridium butyricum]BBK77309.1 hypothetical protein Cbu04g_23170 [Clostridium butyricum]
MGLTDFKALNIDVKQDTYIYPVKLKQNDTPTLNFSIWDDNIAADLTGYRCILKANKNNGKGYEIRDAIISGNNVRVECTSSLSQFAGEVLSELCFIDSTNNKQKTSFNIIIEVQKQVLSINDSGDIPECIITSLEHLDESLSKVESAIQKAEDENLKLNNTITTANNTDSNLNNSIKTGNEIKLELDESIANGKKTIEDLKNENKKYTDHINDLDIHVTLEDKQKWNRIDEVINLIDILTSNVAVTDDDNENVIDDNGNVITM